MYKVLGLVLAIVALSAAECPGFSSKPILTLSGGGATFALVDSVTHGGGDLKLAKTVDTVLISAGASLGNPATSSGSTTSTKDACAVKIEHDPSQTPAVYTVIVGCVKE